MKFIVLVLLVVAACTQVDAPHALNGYGPGKAPHVNAHDPALLATIDSIAKHPADIPPSLNRDFSQDVHIYLKSTEVVSEIAPGVEFVYWTFNNTIPGPFLRVREGDTVHVTLENDVSSSHVHSIDLHAVTGPGGGAVATQVAPGESKSFTFRALQPGLYVYHCATQNVPTHMANGMYGLILVEPKEGLSEVDREFYVMQGELYTQGSIGEQGLQSFSPQKMIDEDPEYVVLNGKVRALVDTPLHANVNETVRLYVGNGGVALTSSFHVIGEIFDVVYPEAASTSYPNVQTTSIPAGGATIVDMTLDVPGNYVLVDHALARIDRGAWGVLAVKGAENPAVYAAD